MDTVSIVMGLIIGFIIGGTAVWLYWQSRSVSLNERLEKEFKDLSLEALKSNYQLLFDLAKKDFENIRTEAKGDLDLRKKEVENLVNPIKEKLEGVNKQIQELEKARKEAYGSITEQVKSLINTQGKLESETGNLVKALRSPIVRGRWGEIQLRKVVEIAGMVSYCDFTEQESVTTDEGRLRPDMIVKLPGDKQVIVDAKAPLQAYLNALESDDEETRKKYLQDHARQIRTHIEKLGAKNYWDQFDETPELVVMFLPGENFFSAALQQDLDLIEKGMGRKVLLASPINLIAILKSIAYGWRQEKIAENAQIISKLGSELYDRLRTLAEHFTGLGKGLERAVDFYNKAVGSLETRVLTSARRFTELGTSSTKEIPDISQIEKTTRSIEAPEFTNPSETENLETE